MLGIDSEPGGGEVSIFLARVIKKTGRIPEPSPIQLEETNRSTGRVRARDIRSQGGT
jgi:hypothetical protein